MASTTSNPPPPTTTTAFPPPRLSSQQQQEEEVGGGKAPPPSSPGAVISQVPELDVSICAAAAAVAAAANDIATLDKTNTMATASAITAGGDECDLEYSDDGRSPSEQCPPPAPATTTAAAAEKMAAAAAVVVPQDVAVTVPVDAGEEASTAATAVVEGSTDQQTSPSASSPSPDVARTADAVTGEFVVWLVSGLFAGCSQLSCTRDL